MPSELNGTMSDNRNNTNGPVVRSPSWQEDRVFLEDLKDVVRRLKVQEASYHRRRIRKQEHYQGRSQRSNSINTRNLPPFYESWRPVMVSWMYHVADTFRLMPIVVSTGTYILDTCAWSLWCSSSSNNNKELYPLMTMTALNMAVKCHETKMFPLEQLVQLLGMGGGSSSERSYTPEDVCAMERKLLHKCGWKLHCPTTHDYLLRFATVLREECRDSVVSAAVMHLKRSLLWEHVLHQKQEREGIRGDEFLFSTCTAAYASFLLSMEDVGLPLADKQAACLALLEVSNLSAQTPHLAQAYTWLFEAKSLQTHLEQGNNPRRAPESSANDTTVPAHATAASPQVDEQPDEPALDEMSCDTTNTMTVVTIEQDSDDEHRMENVGSPMSYGSSNASEHEVIFCSYSTDGDAVEVVASENNSSADDDQSMDSEPESVLPTVLEDEELDPAADNANVVADVSDEEDDEPAKLVLTESLDEDGFEVAFEGKADADGLASLVTSPRDVSIAL